MTSPQQAECPRCDHRDIGGGKCEVTLAGARICWCRHSFHSAPIEALEAYNMDEVDLCKGCNTAKHVNADGLCGRCAPHPEATPDDELESFLRSEISHSMEKAHIAHQLENEWSPEMNLLVSRLMEKYRAWHTQTAARMAVEELQAFYAELTPHENVVDAAADYAKFCKRLEALRQLKEIDHGE
jgi:hypothetical protein